MVRKFKKMTAGEKAFILLNALFLALVAIIMAYPMLHVVFKSLTNYRIDPVTKQSFNVFSFGAYEQVFENKSIFTSFFLTCGVVIVSTILHVFVTMLAAYPLSKKSLPGRSGMLIFVLITMLFSGGLIPYYILIRELGLRNNLLVYIIPGLVSGYNIIIAKNFLNSIPDSLEESAKIDGATDFRVLWSIVLPMSKPIISTIALWFAVGKWNDWMTGMFYVTKQSYMLLQNVLRDMLVFNSNMPDLMGLGRSDKYMLAENIKMAVIVVATVPIICVYPFVQKYFIKGVMLGSVKE